MAKENNNWESKGDLLTGSWTISDVIAYQEEYLHDVLHPSQDAAQEEAKAASPGEATMRPIGKPDAKPLSLQEIIAKQRQQLVEKVAGGQGDAQPGQEAAEAPASSESEAAESDSAEQPQQQPVPQVVAVAAPVGDRKRLSVLSYLLMFNTLVLVLVVVALFYIARNGQAEPQQVVITQVDVDEKGKERKPQAIVEKNPVAGPWQEAERAFRNEKWSDALQRYRFLYSEAQLVPADALVGEFFNTRIAESLIQLGRSKEGVGMLKKLGKSTSPVIRAMANYKLALRFEGTCEYLASRMHAYKALAALQAMGGDAKTEADCKFLIAKAMTKLIRSHFQEEDFVPWTKHKRTDLFMDRKESELRLLLERGKMRGLGMERSVEITKRPNSGRRWTVTCNKMPLTDLLHQFANRVGGADVSWAESQQAMRQRTVTLTLDAVTPHELNEIACGVLGLMARFTLDEVKVYDPAAPRQMSQQRELLAGEVESAWRRFFLTYPDDSRNGEGHFALAAMKHLNQNFDGAMREYQLVAQRYRRSEVAPIALMRAARIKIDIRNYAQARQDLTDLLDIYSDNPLSSEAYLYLGEVSMKEGLYEEAVNVYRKLFHLRLSRESQINACLGAGKCLTLLGRDKEASEWLLRYLEVAKEAKPEDVAEAYLMLGRSEKARGNLVMAREVLQRGLASKPGSKQFVNLALELMRVHMLREDYVETLGVWDALREKKPSIEQNCHGAILASKACTSIGLARRGREVLDTLLREKEISDKTLLAEVQVAMARCTMADGDHETARNLLSQYWTDMKAGQAQWQAGLDLAELCLEMGKASQAIAVAKQLQSPKCPPALRRKGQDVLVSAYLLNKEYDKAAKLMPTSPVIKMSKGNTQ